MRKKIFIINEEIKNEKKVIDEVKHFHNNVSIESYDDYKKLLYRLHTSNNKKEYKIGIIHENGSKSQPSVISSFVRDLNPKVKIIIYTTIDGLKKQLKSVKI